MKKILYLAVVLSITLLGFGCSKSASSPGGGDNGGGNNGGSTPTASIGPDGTNNLSVTVGEVGALAQFKIKVSPSGTLTAVFMYVTDSAKLNTVNGLTLTGLQLVIEKKDFSKTIDLKDWPVANGSPANDMSIDLAGGEYTCTIRGKANIAAKFILTPEFYVRLLGQHNSYLVDDAGAPLYGQLVVANN